MEQATQRENVIREQLTVEIRRIQSEKEQNERRLLAERDEVTRHCQLLDAELQSLRVSYSSR
jgi:hypothetical protein